MYLYDNLLIEKAVLIGLDLNTEEQGWKKIFWTDTFFFTVILKEYILSSSVLISIHNIRSNKEGSVDLYSVLIPKYVW